MSKFTRALLASTIIVLCCLAVYAWEQNFNLQTKLSNVEGENARLKGELQELQQSYDSLMEEHAALNMSYQKLSESYAALNSSYSDLLARHSALNSSYSALNATYFNMLADYLTLNEQYITLNTSYQKLSGSYAALNSSYTSLSKNFASLASAYADLNATHHALLSNYTRLYLALYEPLKNETVPTVQELKGWLAKDPTNTLTYEMPNFICGDYAVMLAFHAKLESWDMGVVAVFGHKANGEEFDHAFNAIICKEGLVYVEPQTDSVWWYPGHSEISGGWCNFPDFGDVYVEEYIIVVWYS